MIIKKRKTFSISPHKFAGSFDSPITSHEKRYGRSNRNHHCHYCHTHLQLTNPKVEK